MWDINPQAHQLYLRDIERQFTASRRPVKTMQVSHPSRFERPLQFLTSGAVAAVVVLVTFSAVAVLLLA